eukprot:TRINITY_DN3539_c0_g4_i1.p1 TRINITY_DN3539_c0_g4~~TRINITY_DN3539_c0_g4_i1.p1  ORF type:complete len:254 (-),score=26.22 TRINITY_DN3539_c0_g4_i1:270-1031(-)
MVNVPPLNPEWQKVFTPIESLPFVIDLLVSQMSLKAVWVESDMDLLREQCGLVPAHLWPHLLLGLLRIVLWRKEPESFPLCLYILRCMAITNLPDSLHGFVAEIKAALDVKVLYEQLIFQLLCSLIEPSISLGDLPEEYKGLPEPFHSIVLAVIGVPAAGEVGQQQIDELLKLLEQAVPQSDVAVPTALGKVLQICRQYPQFAHHCTTLSGVTVKELNLRVAKRCQMDRAAALVAEYPLPIAESSAAEQGQEG